MNKKIIKLTESDLKNIIKEAVEQVMEDEDLDEGKRWDYLNSLFGQYKRQGQENIQKGVNNAKERIRQGVDNVKNFGQRVYQDYNEKSKNATQDSAIKEMQRAFAKFQNAVNDFYATGGKLNNQFKSRIAGINNTLNAYNPHYK